MKECFKTRFPLNIQFFAESNNNGGDEPEPGPEKEKNNEPEKEKNNDDSQKVEVSKKQGVSEFLKGLGIDTEEDLQGIVKKHKENEEKNMNESERLSKKVDTLTKKLAEEQKARISAEAQLEALKLGAKKDMLEDVVIIATAKVTDGKDIKAVLAEMKKAGNSIYFDLDGESGNNSGRRGTTVTRRESGTKKQTDTGNNSGRSNGNDNENSIASRLLGNKKNNAKSHYWGR